MKKWFAGLMAGLVCLSLAACGSTAVPSASDSQAETGSSQVQSNAPVSSAASETAAINSGSHILVVYFSVPETDSPDNMNEEQKLSTVVIDGKVLGNTQYFAKVIADYTGADTYRIEPETAYPTDHDTLVDQAKTEQAEGARPAIKGAIPDLSGYDTVFVGYPNWWGDMPMILYSFFDGSDLSGKTVIPFDTHGGSGLSDTVNTIRSLEPNAEVKGGLAISRNEIQDAKDKIESWVSTMGLKEADNTNTQASAANAQLSLDGKTYSVTLADNETAAAFRTMLPQTLSMQELNGNEKYIYLDTKLPSDAANPGGIQAGDLMLYGDNCIVLFYKSFNTSYTYTKIGHVEGFEDAAASMGTGTITADFSASK
jgi:flavodoxin